MKQTELNFEKLGKSFQILKKLSTPQKIQDFLNTFPFNFEKKGETHSSVKLSLERGTLHCFEGALVAACALWIQGRKPLLLDLKASKEDMDHTVALFKEGNKWGAISKTNHGVLRYREPIYKSVRELVMSYFHEYFLNNGKKTLRSFSKPFDLTRVDTDWLHTDENLAHLAHVLDKSPHTDILSKKEIKNLRLADKVEIETGKIVEYKST